MNILRPPATRILAVSGSLRSGSANTSLLRTAAAVSGADTWVELWCGLRAIPPFDEDGEHDAPAAVTDMRTAIEGADALLIATPEYNGSVPGQLKNALDWASRPYSDSVLSGKPVAVLSASPGGRGGMSAAGRLAEVLTIAGSHVLDATLALPGADKAFDARTGLLRDPEHTAAVAGVVAALEQAVRPALVRASGSS